MRVLGLISHKPWLPLLLVVVSLLDHTPASADETIRYLVIEGNIEDRQRAEVTTRLMAIEGQLSDIDRVRDRLLSLDWIANAEVRFNWPDELVVQVYPEQAIAYWNDLAFINKEGVAFRSVYHAGVDLPHLFGPEDQIEAVLDQYLAIRKALPERAIESVEVRARGAVAFELRSGWQVLLGSEDIDQRLQRAGVVIRRLEAMGVEPDQTRIDARYTDGVAINQSVPTIEALMTQYDNSTKGNEL